MALPTTAPTTYVAGSQLKSADLMAIFQSITELNKLLTGVSQSFWSAGVALAGALTVGGPLAFTGVISPSALVSGATSDYNPTGFSTAIVVRLSGSGGGDSLLTGMAAPANHRVLIMVNVGTDTIVFKNQVTSAAANRLITGTGADVNFLTNQVALWLYDVATTRWRLAKSF